MSLITVWPVQNLVMMKHFTETKISKSSFRAAYFQLFLLLLIGANFHLMAQTKSRFPQEVVNQQLQTASKSGANTASFPTIKNELPSHSLQSLLKIKEQEVSILQSVPKNSSAQNKSSVIDTLVVGFIPNDTVVITGNYTHTGPIYVFNDGVLYFKNATVTNIGEIYVFGHGKLFADSSSLTFPQSYFYERSLLVVQNGYLRMQNCSLNYSGYSHNLFLADSAVVEMTTIHQNDFTTCGLFGSPNLRIDGCNLTGEYILFGNSTTHFSNADTLLLWHHVPDSAQLNYSFPSGDTVLHFQFNSSIPGINGINYSVTVDTCKTVWWGLMPVNGSDVTITNSKIRAIGAWFERGDTASINGLYNNSTYVNFVMPVNDRNLHLITCTVQTWSLYVFDSSRVSISNAQLGEVGCQKQSSVLSNQFILDGSGGYFWATDTSFIVANNVTVYSTVRSEKNGIFILGYSWLPFMPPMAIGNSLMVCVQNKLVQDPIAYDNSNAWLLNIATPDTAYTDTTLAIMGSAWLDQGPQGGWMDFSKYSVSYQALGGSNWLPIVSDSTTEIRSSALANWDVSNLNPGVYLLRLSSFNNLGDSIDCVKAITLLQNTLGTGQNSFSEIGCKVFPNPTDELIQFEISTAHPVAIELNVYTELGIQVVSKKYQLESGTNRIELKNNLVSGNYFYAVRGNNNQSQGKITIF